MGGLAWNSSLFGDNIDSGYRRQSILPQEKEDFTKHANSKETHVSIFRSFYNAINFSKTNLD